MNGRLLWIAGLAAMIAAVSHAQTISVSCPNPNPFPFSKIRQRWAIFNDWHQRVTCIEALFSQHGYHLTMASLPPANGFAPGIVLTHHMSGTIGNPPQDNQVDLSVTGAVSTNGSTFEGGDLVWTLPFGSNDTSTSPQDLQPAGKKNWHDTALHVQAAHQAVHTLYYYGEGPLSPDRQYIYAEDDIWGKATARVSLVGTPLARNVVLTGETGLRATNLPPSGDAEAINKNLPAATLPGYSQQPLFAVNQLGAETRASKHVGGVLPDPLPNDPLLLFFSDWQFDNNASYKWFHNIDESGFSFQQFRFEGDERAFVKARVRRTYEPREHRVLYNTLCQGQSSVRANICNVLMLDVKSRLILSNMSAGNQVPFYLQPTLGGSDFDNNVTLRAWDHYGFRDRDAALVQVDMNALVWDPFGIYVFYDAGTVGNKPADLAFSRFRQDAGFGGTVRIQGNIVAETYLAWGRDRGPRWSFNFSKVF